MRDIVFILGGARSGKSRKGEKLVEACAGDWLYLATAQAHDEEMRARIAHHRARRGGKWRTREVPLDLAAAIAAESRPDNALLVDCLTLWLSNLLHAGRDAESASRSLIDALEAAPGRVVLISNEVGLGIVPDNALARRFRDEAGRLHQAVAAVADRALFMAAGLSLFLKGDEKA